MNSLNLVGRLTKDPTSRKTDNDIDACYFSLAVSRRTRKLKDGEEKTQRSADFISCVAYRKLAQVIMEYVAKGDKIAVKGRIQSYSVKTSDGPRERLICVVDEFDFCNDKGKNQLAPQQEEPHTDVPPSGIPSDALVDIPDSDIPF